MALATVFLNSTAADAFRLIGSGIGSKTAAVPQSDNVSISSDWLTFDLLTAQDANEWRNIKEVDDSILIHVRFELIPSSTKNLNEG